MVMVLMAVCPTGILGLVERGARALAPRQPASPGEPRLAEEPRR